MTAEREAGERRERGREGEKQKTCIDGVRETAEVLKPPCEMKRERKIEELWGKNKRRVEMGA